MDTCFFDLDGTLTDSAPGLLACFHTALQALDVTDVEEASLRRHLGEPLPRIFRSYRPGLSDEDVETGIAAFRQRYDAEGIFINELYPGVKAMLRRVAKTGRMAWIVTSKPTHHAEKVCDILGIRDYFQGLIGAGLDETDTKTTLVRRALDLSGAAPEATLFLGDRNYDVIGALENGVLPVGALWGYGPRSELSEAGCEAFAESPADFARRFVDGRSAGRRPGVTVATGH